MAFRDVVIKNRDERNLTNKDIAHFGKCSEQYISDLLKGARRFNEDLEKRICDGLGLEKVYVDKTV